VVNEGRLRIFPFGGVGEFGKNMMLYALGNDAVMVDCGMGFPEPGQHGVDVVIPDISSLKELGLKLHAIVLTHGHEDHVGALPFLLPDLDVPVYGTEMTLGLVGGKMSEVKDYSADLRRLPENQSIHIGPFDIEAIPVTHSIMDAVSIAIRTPVGIIVHTGDFKFDPAPIDGRATSLHRFASLGDEGVLLLLSDSTNAMRAGSGPTERIVGPALKQALGACTGKVVVTTFSSNMFRIQQIVDAAAACGRTIALAGRSLERNVGIARRLGRLNAAADQFVGIKQIADMPDREVLVIATGSQGESRAALARIATGQFAAMTLRDGDLVIFSSSMIPGNERAITGLFNHIYRRGARVLHAGQAPLHVSGHAQAHELKTMIQLVRPRFMIPVHGEYRNLVEHGHLAVAAGIPEENVLIVENGQIVEVGADGLRTGESFHAGAVFVDGEMRDEIDGMVLRDRRRLAQDGIIMVVVTVSRQEGCLTGTPELAARGVLHQEVGDEVIARAAEELRRHLEETGPELLGDDDAAGEEIRIWLRRWFRQRHGRRPMVLPVVIEV